MQIDVLQTQPIPVARIRDEAPLLATPSAALELLANLRWTNDCGRAVIYKEEIAPDFFRLSTCLAGEVLQKFVNYQGKLAIVGDFSQEKSHALRDFIRESNRGHAIFFVPTEAEAVARLTAAD